MMISIQLERYENYLVLPDHLPEQNYVICPTDDANCWHILPTELNDQVIKQMVAPLGAGEETKRLKMMLQGNYRELERQGNLLLLPQHHLFSVPGCTYVLKLAN